MTTKKDMIETIQEKEAELNKKLKESARKHGYDDRLTEHYLAMWAPIYELMRDLGIKRVEA